VIETLPVRGFDVFFGEIVAAYANEDCTVDGRPDPTRIHPMIMMGTSYWTLGKAMGSIYREGRRFERARPVE